MRRVVGTKGLGNCIYLMRAEQGRVLHLSDPKANREPARPLTLHLSSFPLCTRNSDFFAVVTPLLAPPPLASGSS